MFRLKGLFCAILLVLLGLLVMPISAVPQPVTGQFQANSNSFGRQYAPNIAMNNNEQAVVAWHGVSNATNNTEIFARVFDTSGLALTIDLQANTTTVGYQYTPAVAIAPNGDFVVVWNNQNKSILARLYTADGTPKADPFKVNAIQDTSALLPAVAMDANGNFVVVWRSGDYLSRNWTLYARQFNAAGTPQGNEIIVKSDFNILPNNSFNVAVAPDGRFVVAWHQEIQAYFDTIRAQRYDAAGVAIGGSIVVNQMGVTNSDRVDVAMDATGDFVVTWNVDDWGQGTAGIFARLFTANGGPTTNAMTVSTDATFAGPSVAMNGVGDFVVTWDRVPSFSYPRYSVHGRYFNQLGFAEGEAVQFNTTTQDQAVPVVTMNGLGDFVAAWVSPDGNDTGVFGRVFRAPPDLYVSADAVNFGQQTVGTGSSVKTVQVANYTANSIDITALDVIGSANHYTFGTAGNPCAVGPLAAGAVCTVDVRFSPLAAGDHPVQIALSTSIGENRVITLNGNGYSIGTLPTDMLVTGELTTPPVEPVLRWSHRTSQVATTVPGDRYTVYLAADDGTVIVNESFGASQVCTGVDCALPLADYLPVTGLDNGTYRWWVGARMPGGQQLWSGNASNPATFTVAVPAPALPAAITVDPRQGRPLLTWADDINALYVQLWIGPNTEDGSFNKWLLRNADSTCDGTTCTYAPAIDWSAGTYEVWMQAWGPGGYSSGGTDDPLRPAWVSGPALVLPDVIPAAPTNLAAINLGSSNPTFTWDSMANTTYYQLTIAPVNGAWAPYSTWHLGYDLSAACGDVSGPCTWADPALDGVLNAGQDYVIRVRGWGPGGMSAHSPDVTFTFGG